MADDEAVRRLRRARLLGLGVFVAVFAATLVALGLAFPDAHGRSLLAGLRGLERQPWMLLATALFAGLALGGLVQTRLATPPKKT